MTKIKQRTTWAWMVAWGTAGVAMGGGVHGGCSTDAPACAVTCEADDECPDGQTCGALGLCSPSGACACEPGSFLACGSADTLERCSAEGDAPATETCASGCNAEAGRCNACVPSQVTCSADRTHIETCNAEGLPLAPAPCDLPCVDATDTVGAHCGYVSPVWLPDACDALATAESLVLTDGMIDTSDAAVCNGGVVAQTGGPELCVVRYRTITVEGAMRVTGPRVLALIADDELRITGDLDVSASGTVSGPGFAGIAGSGVGQPGGGGGAGFLTTGGFGGGSGEFGGGGAGGAMVDPTTRTLLAGGYRVPGTSGPTAGDAVGGGGGGALLLVGCRGPVVLDGVIDAGGGGGQGGGDSNPLAEMTRFRGGAGGGSGGYVVIQGAAVTVTATGALWANGGGGGGGASSDGARGGAGYDGARSTIAAGGGSAYGTGGAGGMGGTGRSAFPGAGAISSVAAGGGGGAAGWLQIYTPKDVAPTVTSTNISPPLEPVRVVPTR